jgi:hypothetical protein
MSILVGKLIENIETRRVASVDLACEAVRAAFAALPGRMVSVKVGPAAVEIVVAVWNDDDDIALIRDTMRTCIPESLRKPTAAEYEAWERDATSAPPQ